MLGFLRIKNKHINPIKDTDHNEINLLRIVVEVATFILIFCTNRIPIALASVVPIPPGINDIAPNKPDANWDTIASSIFIFALNAFSNIKKIIPSKNHAIIPTKVAVINTFGFKRTLNFFMEIIFILLNLFIKKLLKELFNMINKFFLKKNIIEEIIKIIKVIK